MPSSPGASPPPVTSRSATSRFRPRRGARSTSIAIAPAFRLFESLPDAFVAVKAINCVLMSCAAVPAYLLAKRLLARQTALFVAALAVAVPSGIYTSKIMAESLAYPLFLLAALAVVRVLEERTWQRELLALGAIGLAMLGRAQLVVLLPAFVLSLVILAVAEERDRANGVKLGPLLRRLGAYRVTTSTVVALAALLVLGKVVGVGPSGVAGAHNEAFGAADPGCGRPVARAPSGRARSVPRAAPARGSGDPDHTRFQTWGSIARAATVLRVHDQPDVLHAGAVFPLPRGGLQRQLPARIRPVLLLSRSSAT